MDQTWTVSWTFSNQLSGIQYFESESKKSWTCSNGCPNTRTHIQRAGGRCWKKNTGTDTNMKSCLRHMWFMADFTHYLFQGRGKQYDSFPLQDKVLHMEKTAQVYHFNFGWNLRGKWILPLLWGEDKYEANVIGNIAMKQKGFWLDYVFSFFVIYFSRGLPNLTNIDKNIRLHVCCQSPNLILILVKIKIKMYFVAEFLAVWRIKQRI